MVAGAWLGELANGVISIFSGINSRSGNTENGSGGNVLGETIKNFFDNDGNGGLGDIVKQTIQESLTVDNLNTVKDLLRTYWGDHSGPGHEEEEPDLRKNLDNLRSALGTEGVAGKLAQAIKCIENGETGVECGGDHTVLEVGVTSLNDMHSTESASVESFGFNGRVRKDNNTYRSIIP